MEIPTKLDVVSGFEALAGRHRQAAAAISPDPSQT
jgi:hypothetical protein